MTDSNNQLNYSNYSWYVVKNNNGTLAFSSLSGSSYTVSASDVFSNGSKKIYLLANTTGTTPANAIFYETKYGSVPKIADTNGTKIEGLSNVTTADFKGWKLLTGANPGTIYESTSSDNKYQYSLSDATAGIVILEAIWDEKKYDLSKAYQLNNERNIYPEVKWGSSFNLTDPYHTIGGLPSAPRIQW